MILFDVVDMDETRTVNFMWQNKFVEPSAKVGAQLWFGSYEKSKLKKKRKMIDYDGS